MGPSVSYEDFFSRTIWVGGVIFFFFFPSGAQSGDLGPSLTPVFMVTKSCTKILNFSTKFSCKHFAVEDFVRLPMGKKSCRWGNAMFGHGFDKLV